MRSSDPKNPDDRLKVSILLPTGRDAQLVADIARNLRFNPIICTGLQDLLNNIGPDSGPFIIGDEALGIAASVDALAAAVKDQPEWSDLPGIIVMRPATAPRI